MRPAKLYLVTRADMPPGVQASQLAHAAIEASVHYPEQIREWHDTSNTVVLLAAADEAALT